MKKINIIATTSIMILSMSSLAHSAEGLYVAGNIGAAIAVDSKSSGGFTGTNTLKTGLAAGVALGYDFGYSIRAEVEYTYRKNDLDQQTSAGVTSTVTSGDITVHTVLINGFYDLKNQSPITPFISTGIGFSSIDYSEAVLSGITSPAVKDTVFAYQVGAGAAYAINETISLDVKYRYISGSKASLANNVKTTNAAHRFDTGLRVAF
ncbi:MAG: outer membrane beta-barrel protein [Mariprofundaceae bacterium]